MCGLRLWVSCLVVVMVVGVQFRQGVILVVMVVFRLLVILVSRFSCMVLVVLKICLDMKMCCVLFLFMWVSIQGLMVVGISFSWVLVRLKWVCGMVIVILQIVIMLILFLKVLFCMCLISGFGRVFSVFSMFVSCIVLLCCVVVLVCIWFCIQFRFLLV